MRISIDNIDFEERDNNNKPIWKYKEVIDNITSISKIIDNLNDLETRYKKDITAGETKHRGEEAAGYDED